MAKNKDIDKEVIDNYKNLEIQMKKQSDENRRLAAMIENDPLSVARQDLEAQVLKNHTLAQSGQIDPGSLFYKTRDDTIDLAKEKQRKFGQEGSSIAAIENSNLARDFAIAEEEIAFGRLAPLTAIQGGLANQAQQRYANLSSLFGNTLQAEQLKGQSAQNLLALKSPSIPQSIGNIFGQTVPLATAAWIMRP